MSMALIRIEFVFESVDDNKRHNRQYKSISKYFDERSLALRKSSLA